MALYEITYDDGCGHARHATRSRRDAAAWLFSDWCEDALRSNGLMDRPIRNEAFQKAHDFERFTVARTRVVVVPNGSARGCVITVEKIN